MRIFLACDRRILRVWRLRILPKRTATLFACLGCFLTCVSVLTVNTALAASESGISAASAEAGSQEPKSLPVPIHTPAPPYDPAERDAGHAGTVRLRLHVGADGRVKEASVNASSGWPVLDAQSVAAARLWTFSPALDAAGTPMESVAIVPLNFHGAEALHPGRYDPQYAPHFPADAHCVRASGVARIRASIDASGAVLNVVVDTSSGNPSLDREAIRAVRGWRFAPGLKDGVAVGGDVIVPVNFQPPLDPLPEWCAQSVRVRSIAAVKSAKLLEEEQSPVLQAPASGLMVTYSLVDPTEDGKPVVARWFFHGRGGGRTPREVARVDTVLHLGGIQSEILVPKSTEGWPTGAYTVQLDFGKKMVATRSFRVRD
jgi:protein TonB